jgi:hypothetical protein
MSTLVLGSVDGNIPDLGARHQDLEPLGKAFDPSTGLKGTLPEMTGHLQDALSKKKKGFSNTCFDELSPAANQSQPPRPSEPSQSYGQDGSDDYIVNGPIVACGQFLGEDVLTVYDANGVLMGMVSRNEAKEHPEQFTDILQLAEQANLKIPEISERALLIQFDDAKYIGPTPTPPEDGPDDQLFEFSEKKKKKSILGILGGGKSENLESTISGVFGVSVGGGEAAKVKDQWGLRKIGFRSLSDPASAWRSISGEQPNVVVAVIDSGLDFTHPDGPARIWTNRGEIPNNNKDDDGNGYIDDMHGWNFLNENVDVTDYNGHGTFVAGIIAAKRNNEIGIAGINPGAVIMPLKVGNKDGETNDLAVFRAIHYAVNNGVRVINLSLGARGISPLEQSAVNYAHAHDVFVSVASGNNGLYIGELGPASAKRAFVVGAIDMDGRRSTISSWGPNNAIMAPGELIYSIRSQDSMGKSPIKDPFLKLYFAQSGTSFSAPMVSATASLLLARNPQLTKTEIEGILIATAADLDEAGWDDLSGAGVLNATAAFEYPGKNPVRLQIAEMKFNLDKRGKIISVDLFATVSGDFKNYTVEAGKGKLAKSFKTIAGPFTQAANNDWIRRLEVDEDLKGSKDWIVRLKAVDARGKEHTAQALLLLMKNPVR